jgi:hypothetical protein
VPAGDFFTRVNDFRMRRPELCLLSNRKAMNKSIRTEIIINASPEKVWSILTDFGHYPDWNPFIRSISGQLKVGSRLTNAIFNGSKEYVFRPKVLSVLEGKYFDWLGHLGIKGLFDGHHYFEIEELGAGQVKLSHGEDFSGILSGYILKKIANDTRAGFVRMNQAIRDRAEEGNN